MLFWNTFSEPKKTKDAKEAEVEDKNLEKTIEESLWSSEMSESFREFWK